MKKFPAWNRHPSWILVLLAVVFSTCLNSQAIAAFGEPKAEQQPNILFIIADDYSYDSVQATGNDEINTPNIDSIAKAGTTFSHAYNMGGWNGAICVASRTMLNTGRFIWRANRLKLNDEVKGQRTWSLQMKKAGYETYFTGKWHVKMKPAKIFDYVAHVRGGMPRQTPEGYLRPDNNKPNKWQPWDKSKGGFWQGGKHWSEVVGDDAIGFLDNAKQSDKPFFMYIAFNAPHDPRQSPKEFVDQYPIDKIKVPADFQPRYKYQDKMGCGPKLRDARLAPFPRTKEAVKLHRQEYYAIITHMDREIGRILKKLEAANLSDNTIVFFTADHGLACGHHGLIGKQNMYDHSMRVPFFIKGRGIEAGKRINTKIYLQDAMATSLEMAHGKKPEFVEFKSLVPLMKGSRTIQYDSIYGAYQMLQRMVIKDNHKLIVYPTAENAVRLYDLKADPMEMNDLAAKETNRVEVLKKELGKLQQSMDDKLKLGW